MCLFKGIFNAPILILWVDTEWRHKERIMSIQNAGKVVSVLIAIASVGSASTPFKVSRV
jgi:hypothetical protein